MERRKNWLHRRYGLLCAIGAVLLSMPLPSGAANGRDYAGFYSMENVQDLGEQTSLTLKVQLFNFSDGAIANAPVTLQPAWFGQGPWEEEGYGVLGYVTLNDRTSALLSADFTVSTHEYQSWLEGAQPLLQVHLPGGDGGSLTRPVELMFMPLLMEVTP